MSTVDDRVLCVWGALDGHWVPDRGRRFTARGDVYRLLPWVRHGRSEQAVYVLGGFKDGVSLATHPQTLVKVRQAMEAVG